MNKGYLHSAVKNECVGCEACVQVCRHKAIIMVEDAEGFRYPVVNKERCNDCGLCHSVCPMEHEIRWKDAEKVVLGGHHKDSEVVHSSTSGGAFSAIVDAWCDDNYVIFGAQASGMYVSHSYVTNKQEINRFRKAKYLQSVIGDSFARVKEFLQDGKKVLFSGTPCQIAGLERFLGKTDRAKLLTVEVICEGVPSPLLIKRITEYYEDKMQAQVKRVDYRDKNASGCWDFEMMRIETAHGVKVIDRWFNPFWSIWLQHLVSRSSCYTCPFATAKRVADISLGDLWGVHIYCPDLYNRNRGASLVISNSEKGANVLNNVAGYMEGRILNFEDAVRYQSPLRKPIAYNERRDECLADLGNAEVSYGEIVKKYAVKPSADLLFRKYVWGNRQKMWLWNIFNKNKHKHVLLES